MTVPGDGAAAPLDQRQPEAGSATEVGRVVEAYGRWAPVYDLVFAAVMRAGRAAAAAAASEAAGVGGRIVDIGVGTGLELPMFDARSRVVGIDLSEPMLRGAQRRVRRERLDSVEGLSVMDATRLAFPDACFDAAIVPYVLTVVPEPHRMLDEIRRVVRPGGEIVLVNHFGAEGGLLGSLEGWLGRHAASLGWDPQFPFAVLGDWITATPGIGLVERRRIRPFGLFNLVRLRRGA